MQHQYVNTYENIRIRPLEKKDIEKLRMWRNDKKNATFLRKMPYITEKMQNDWFLKYLDCRDEVIFAIEEIVKLNRVVGSLSLYDIKDRECTFGKILIGDAETRGQGIGTKATKAAIKVALDSLGVSRIILFVYRDNEPALRAYRNAGFKVIDEHYDLEGHCEYTMEYRK